MSTHEPSRNRRARLLGARLRSRRARTALLVGLNTAQVLLGLAVFALHTEAAAAQARPAWTWPLGGETTVDNGFRPPQSAWGAGHRGVDLRGQLGEWVLAAGDGVVSYSGLLAGRGVVVVKHANGLRTTYEPVVAGVSVGTQVTEGDRIGSLAAGHAGCLPGTTCLHWGLLRGETYLDPLLLVTQGRLRLLPVRPARVAAAPPPGALGGGAPAASTAAPLLALGPPDPGLGSPVAAVAHPRRRVGELVLTQAVNVTGLGLLGWGAWSGGRRVVRRVRR